MLTDLFSTRNETDDLSGVSHEETDHILWMRNRYGKQRSPNEKANGFSLMCVACESCARSTGRQAERVSGGEFGELSC